MSTQTVSRGINIFINSGEAEKALERLTKKEEQFKKELEAATNPKAIERLNKEIAALKEPIDRAAKKFNGELAPSIRDTQSLVTKLNNELKKMSASDDGYKQKLQQFGQANELLRQQKKEIDSLKNAQKGLGDEGGHFAKVFSNVAEYFSAYAIIEKGTELVKDFFSGTIEEAQQAEEAVDGLKVSLENAGRAELLQPLLDEADQFAAKYKALDNDDITKVFTKLISYGKLTKSQITDVTDVIVNYARKQKVSLEEATDVITKSLEGNAKGLKTFGINMNDAKTFTERYALVVHDLGNKVKGAETAFEETSTGGIAKFKQAIRDTQEEIGKFFINLINGPKSANQVFDEAKAHIDSTAETINTLLSRYDELKAKTTLNKDEQVELQGTINKIAEVVPGAATAIDQYGNVLDINRGKVTGFLNENAKFLQAREADAINELQQKANGLVSDIKGRAAQLTEINKELIAVEKNKAFFLPADYQKRVTELQSLFSQANTAISKGQHDLIENTDVLINKYKIGLTGAVLDFRNQAVAIAFGKDQVDKTLDKKDTTVVGNTKTPEQEEAEKRAKEDADRLAKEAAQRRKEEQRRIAQEHAQFVKDLEKFHNEVGGLALSEVDRELLQLAEKFEELRKRAEKNNEDSLQLNRDYWQGYIKIVNKGGEKELEELEKKDKEKQKQQEQFVQNALELGVKAEQRIASAIAETLDENSKNKTAGIQLELLKARGKERLQKQLELLDDEEKQELSKKGLTENEKLRIEEEFRLKRGEAEKNFLVQQVQDYVGIIQQMVGVLEIFDKAKTDKENAELSRDKKLNDKKKATLDKRLKSGAISQQEYDRQVEALEKKKEKREHEVAVKQFKRSQKMQIIQALMNGAMAVTSTIAAMPGPFDIATLGIARAIQIGLMIATTAAQVATIASQKPPQLARGGRLFGPSHSDNNGMPVVHPHTGQVQAYVEGGEAIVNKRTIADSNVYELKGTPSQIISGLNALHGGVGWEPGGVIRPAWSVQKPMPMNFAAIGGGIRRMYADGGKFNEASGTSSTGAAGISSAEMLLALKQMVATNERLNNTLSLIQQYGVTAVVPLSSIEDAQKRKAAILEDATIKA